MIIKCPTCGFSGRVPSYVTVVPHHARCPKCQQRFALRDQLAAQAPGVVAEAARSDLRHDLARPRLDPSSSSYEIEALTDDFDEEDFPAGGSDNWGDDDWDGAIDPDDDPVEDPAGDGVPVSAPARPTRLPGFLLRGEEPAAMRAGIDRDHSTRTAAVSWRFRLFEVWAILFVVWAALIGGRGILATVSREQDFLFSTATLWPVASVVLLVVSSAGLLFLIDLSRRFAAPTATEPTSAPRLAKPSGGSIERPVPMEPVVIRPGRQPTV